MNQMTHNRGERTDVWFVDVLRPRRTMGCPRRYVETTETLDRGPGSPVAAEDESDRAGEGQGTSADVTENSMG